MRILITGGRNWKDYATILDALQEHYRSASHGVLIHGDCKTGADHIVDLIARKYDLNVERYPADWEEHGRKAGPLRNQHMVNIGADICLAFDTGGRGTADCMMRARKAGIPVIVYREGNDG